jgi:hypothetical protein
VQLSPVVSNRNNIQEVEIHLKLAVNRVSKDLVKKGNSI